MKTTNGNAEEFDKRKTTEVEIRVPYTDAELAEFKDNLVAKVNQYNEDEESARNAASAARERLKEQRAEIDHIASEVRAGHHYVMVSCYSEPDYIRHIMNFVDQRTGEIVKTRKMLPEELQLHMFPQEAEADAA